MEEFVVLRHGDLNFESEKDIIAIKQEHWNHSKDSQKKWLHSNLKNDDMHLLLYVDGQLSAYLNLVNIAVCIDEKKIDALGIGNVCVDKCRIRKGYGRKIVQRANEIIIEKNKIGILLCKESLEGFYSRLDWQKIRCNDVSVADKDFDKTIMLFNSSITQIAELSIDRNF